MLVVDDEPSIRDILRDFMEMKGWDVALAASGEAALELIAARGFDAVVTDLKMGRVDGIAVLEAARARDPHVGIVMMTGFGTVESAIEAMKKGAFDYVLKPFKVPELLRIVSRSIAQRRLQLENLHLRELVGLYDVTEIIGRSLSLDAVVDVLVETTRERLGCDVVSLFMAPASGEDKSGQGQYTGRRTGEFRPTLEMFISRFWAREGLNPDAVKVAETLNPIRLVPRFEGETAVVLEGPDAWACVGDSAAAEGANLAALVSFSLRGRDGVIGLMTGFAFHRQHRFSEGRRKMLSMIAGRGAAAIDNARLYENLKETFWQTIQGLANILENKDPYTRGHSERVKFYAGMLAEAMDLGAADVDRIKEAALLHDIGKLSIRIEDLNKPGPLTPGEYETFKSHTTRGRWLLEPITFLHNLIPGVYHHHERWDGEGYPLGLKGTEIPLDARIMSLADSYDAMTSNRAYRRALPHEVAIAEINKGIGTQFDPELAALFVVAIDKHKAGHRQRQRRWAEILDKNTDGTEAAGVGVDGDP